MVFEAERHTESQLEAICWVADKLGPTPETVRKWVRRVEIDDGQRPGLTTDERERLKALERENRELRCANEMTRTRWDLPRRRLRDPPRRRRPARTPRRMRRRRTPLPERGIHGSHRPTPGGEHRTEQPRTPGRLNLADASKGHRPTSTTPRDVIRPVNSVASAPLGSSGHGRARQ
jgi:transposase-like protein